MKNLHFFAILFSLIFYSCNDIQEISTTLEKAEEQEEQIQEMEEEMERLYKFTANIGDRLSYIYHMTADEFGNEVEIIEKKRTSPSYERPKDSIKGRMKLNELKRELVLMSKYLDLLEENLNEEFKEKSNAKK